MLDMMIPHLHEFLLSRVHICEIINHLAGLNLKPLRVWLVLLILPVQYGM